MHTEDICHAKVFFDCVVEGVVNELFELCSLLAVLANGYFLNGFAAHKVSNLKLLYFLLREPHFRVSICEG